VLNRQLVLLIICWAEGVARAKETNGCDVYGMG
jgi:hypothetical protein